MPQGKRRKSGKQRDPNHPKRAKSGFMFFSIAHREKVLKQYPGISFVDVGRKIGELWANCEEATKESYEKLATEDQVRYRNEMSTYIPPAADPLDVDSLFSGGTSKTKSDSKNKNKNKFKDPNAPRRSLSAYIHFCSANRDAIFETPTQLKKSDVAKTFAEKWRNLSLDERIPFEELARKDKARFEREMAVYTRSKLA